MKKSIAFVLLIGFAILGIGLVSAILSPLTAKAISQPTNVSIWIIQGPLALNIISPANGTYLTNISIPLDYHVSNADNVSYNLDNGANISIGLSHPVYFNTSEGTHTIYVYANKNGAIIAKNVTFNVNLTRLIISYIPEFKGSYRGNSTDFYSYSYEQLQNLSDICLEDIRYGKICFHVPINVIMDEFPLDNFVPVEENTNIFYNINGMNITALPNFNKSATIWIYNLTLTNPRILLDGSPCPSSICTYESYIGGTLKFNVTGFSYYSADESPTAPPIPPPACASPPCGPSPSITNATPGFQIAPCIAEWQCSNWSTSCINGFYKRTCYLDKWYCAAEFKPITERKCEIPEEKPYTRSFLRPLDCCLFGICWFRFIICWYWWLLILIVTIILIWIICKYLKKRRKQIVKYLRKRYIIKKPVESIKRGNYIEFKTPKNE